MRVLLTDPTRMLGTISPYVTTSILIVIVVIITIIKAIICDQ